MSDPVRTDYGINDTEWEAARQHYLRVKAERERLARIHDAGPALLVALKGMLAAYAPNADETVAREGEAALHCSVRQARAAIAKAEGREA